MSNVYLFETKKQKEKKDYKKSVHYCWQPTKGYLVYAFTVKVTHNLKSATEKSYERFFNNLFARVEVICYCGEFSPREVLHYHGSIRFRTHFNRKKLRIKGYHLYLEPVRNFQAWTNYCFKNNILYCWEKFKHKLI